MTGLPLAMLSVVFSRDCMMFFVLFCCFVIIIRLFLDSRVKNLDHEEHLSVNWIYVVRSWGQRLTSSSGVVDCKPPLRGKKESSAMVGGSITGAWRCLQIPGICDCVCNNSLLQGQKINILEAVCVFKIEAMFCVSRTPESKFRLPQI